MFHFEHCSLGGMHPGPSPSGRRRFLFFAMIVSLCCRWLEVWLGAGCVDPRVDSEAPAAKRQRGGNQREGTPDPGVFHPVKPQEFFL